MHTQIHLLAIYTYNSKYTTKYKCKRKRKSLCSYSRLPDKVPQLKIQETVRRNSNNSHVPGAAGREGMWVGGWLGCWGAIPAMSDDALTDGKKGNLDIHVVGTTLEL